MTKVTLGIVCHTESEHIEDIKNYIEMLEGDIVVIKQSWGKLWLKEGQP